MKARTFVSLVSFLCFMRVVSAQYSYDGVPVPISITRELFNQRIPGQEAFLRNVSDPKALPVAVSFPLNGWIRGFRLQVFDFEDLLANCSCIGGIRRNCLKCESNGKPCSKNVVPTTVADLVFYVKPVGRNYPGSGQFVSFDGTPLFGDTKITQDVWASPIPRRRRHLLAASATATRTRTRTPRATPTQTQMRTPMQTQMRTPTRTPTRACSGGNGCVERGSPEMIGTAMNGDGNWTITLLNFCLLRYYGLDSFASPFDLQQYSNKSECLGLWDKIVIRIDFEGFCFRGPTRVSGAEMPYTQYISWRVDPTDTKNCTWVLESPPGSTMTVVFTPPIYQNSFVSIVLYDGPSTGYPPLLSIKGDFDLPRVVQTSTNVALLSRVNSGSFVFTVSYGAMDLNRGKVWSRPEMSLGIPIRTSTGSYYYVAYLFRPSKTDKYMFATPDPSGCKLDTVMGLYWPSFSPSSPLTNILAFNDDATASDYFSQFSIQLYERAIYVIVVSTYAPNATGTFNLVIVDSAGRTVDTGLTAASDSVYLTGKIENSDPKWYRPYGAYPDNRFYVGVPPAYLFDRITRYDVYRIYTPIADTYSFTTEDPTGTSQLDTVMVLYTQFDPTFPLANILCFNDDTSRISSASRASSFSSPLNAMTQYTLVVTTNSDSTTLGPYTLTLPGAVVYVNAWSGGHDYQLKSSNLWNPPRAWFNPLDFQFMGLPNKVSPLTVNYKSFVVYTTIPGTYDFKVFMNQADMMDTVLALYTPPFDPSTPLTSLQVFNDDPPCGLINLRPATPVGSTLTSAFTYTLQAMKHYILVVSGVTPRDQGAFYVQVADSVVFGTMPIPTKWSINVTNCGYHGKAFNPAGTSYISLVSKTDTYSSGAVILTEVFPPPRWFRVSFLMNVGGGSGADGMAFSYGNLNEFSNNNGGHMELAGETGAGNGLIVSFDASYGQDGAAGIVLKLGGQLLDLKMGPAIFRQNMFIPVVIEMTQASQTGYRVYVQVLNSTTFDVRDYYGEWPVDSDWKMMFSARVGLRNDNHFVGNISVQSIV